MNNNPAFAKCDCQNCGNHIEFPIDGAGMTIPCPHCGQLTPLGLSPTTQTQVELSSSDILMAFNGSVSPTRASFFYQLGLMLVTVMMVILPILYLALIGLAGWGIYKYATHFTFLLSSGRGGARLYIAKLMLYFAPLFIGTILVLFMIKPLFAKRPPHAQPLAMNPASEPKLFAFIAKLCQVIGAPIPNRIDLDCNLNASASFRRGMVSFLGNDLVLTIGLPLVAGLSIREFAGVMAHEFGHFTQGFGMRLSYVIRSISAWFARVVYDRDELDVWLERTATEAEDWRWAIIVGCAQFGVWFSRQILKLLMWTGHGVSCFLLRQMEYDADSYEIKLAGSQAFETAARRMHVLGALLKPTYNSMRATFNLSRELPDNFPEYLMKQDSALPKERRTQLEDTMGLGKSGLFHTHPSDGDRIRCARQMNEQGIFHMEAPATILFSNFDIVSKQVTQVHYMDDIGLPVEATKLVPVHPPAMQPATPSPLSPSAGGEAEPAIPGRLKIKR